MKMCNSTLLKRTAGPLTCALSVVALASFAFAQGTLTPPGPPGPTMQTLDQLAAKAEKRIPLDHSQTITQPGSYYLTRNIQTKGAKFGIVISADNVTVDLNGFSLIGLNPPTGAGGGILMDGTRQNICVKNGTITGFNAGIAGNATSSTVSNSRFVNLIVSYNKGIGMDIADESEVRDCVVTHNVNGIKLRNGCRVLDCIVNLNPGRGIEGNDQTAVESCTVSSNSGDGIEVNYGSLVKDCVVRFNYGTGIIFHGGCRILGNLCDLNHDHGLFTNDNASRVEGNTATYNGAYGVSLINLTGNNLIIGNSARGNTSGGFNYTSPNTVGNIVSASGGATLSPGTANALSNIDY